MRPACRRCTPSRPRVYTVLKSSDCEVRRLLSKGNWDPEVVRVTDLHLNNTSQPAEYSSVAVARSVSASGSGPIYLFYQPSPKVIGLVLIANYTGQASDTEARNVERPGRISTFCGLGCIMLSATCDVRDFVSSDFIPLYGMLLLSFYCIIFTNVGDTSIGEGR
jgi:hypothetical protein